MTGTGSMLTVTTNRAMMFPSAEYCSAFGDGRNQLAGPATPRENT